MTKSFATKGSWALTWSYDCVNVGKKAKFTLFLRSSGDKVTTVTSQEGLGGGGNRSFGAGTFSAKVTTRCQWRVQATR